MNEDARYMKIWESWRVFGIEEGFGQGMKGKRMHGAEGMRGKGMGQGFEGNCPFTDSE